MEIVKKLENSKFSDKIKKIKHVASLILPKINAYFPTYTDHGVAHSEKVLSIINTLIKNCDKLTDEELFCLYCSAWLHDIGMVGDVDPRLMTDYYRTKIRDEHHFRSFSIIINEREKFGLSERQAKIIAWISRAHSSRFNEWEKLKEIGGKFNVQLCSIAAVLRLADELDLTAERAGRFWSERMPPTRESSIHFDKHLSVKNVKVEDDQIILVLYRLGTCYDEKMKEDISEKLSGELKRLKEYLEDIGLDFKHVKCVLSKENAPYLSMLIRQDILWCLSVNRKASLESIARLYEHNVESVKNVLQKLMEEGLVEETGDGNYSLRKDGETFLKIAGIFLSPSLEEAPGRSFGFKKGGMHFVSSTYVEDCITDEFVLRVLKEWNVSEENNNCKRPNWLSLQDYKHIFQCSPTALRRAIFPGAEFTRRILNDNGEIIMGKDEPLLRFAVLTGLINDYIRYHEFASQICKIKCFEVVVNGFQHFLRFKGKEDLYFIEKAQYGPFDKEYQYGYHIKFKKVSNDWGI